jgi:hypothetical protein
MAWPYPQILKEIEGTAEPARPAGFDSQSSFAIRRDRSDSPSRGFSPGKTTPRDLYQITVIAKLLYVSSNPKSNLRNDNRRLKKKVSAAKSDSGARYPVSRRFRHSGRLSRTSRWSAVARSFGLSASEGQFYRCPVSRPIPVKK